MCHKSRLVLRFRKDWLALFDQRCGAQPRFDDFLVTAGGENAESGNQAFHVMPALVDEERSL